MPKTISKARFNRLCRSEAFNQQLKDLSETSNSNVFFLNEHGREVLCFLNPKLSAFNQTVKKLPLLLDQIHNNRQLQSVNYSSAKISLPWHELIHPMLFEQEPVGYWVLSAFRKTSQSSMTEENWRTLKQHKIHISREEWSNILVEFPVWSRNQTGAWKRQLQIQEKEAKGHWEKETGQLPKDRSLSAMVLKACKEIRKNYTEPIRLNDLAKRCLVSPEHLSRSFHQQTGLRFSDYIAETRINAVCDKLDHTIESISEIAGSCGFSTLSRFNQCFKSVTGMTPRAWRNRTQ